MLLSARMLTDVASVNVFRNADQVTYTEGDAPTFYFQLIDASLDRDLRPAGRRFMPAAGATLQVVLHSIDDNKTVTRYATQPFATDPSIWRVVMLATDKLRGTVSMKLVLTETAVVTRGFVDAALRVVGQTQAR